MCFLLKKKKHKLLENGKINMILQKLRKKDMKITTYNTSSSIYLKHLLRLACIFKNY